MMREIMILILNEARTRDPDDIHHGLQLVRNDVYTSMTEMINGIEAVNKMPLDETKKEELRQLVLTVD